LKAFGGSGMVSKVLLVFWSLILELNFAADPKNSGNELFLIS
jgi:hypothetical protein